MVSKIESMYRPKMISRLMKSTNALSYQFHESLLNKTDENIEF